MQESSYCECLVKVKTSVASLVVRFLLIALAIISATSIFAFFNMNFGLGVIFSLVILVIDVGILIFAFSRANSEWEYIFVDGQIDFDQIYNGSTRKHRDRIDFDDVEVIAPTGSSALSYYLNKDVKIFDYSSKSGSNTYDIIVRKKNSVARIIFEPNEKMLGFMKQKSPRKFNLS